MLSVLCHAFLHLLFDFLVQRNLIGFLHYLVDSERFLPLPPPPLLLSKLLKSHLEMRRSCLLLDHSGTCWHRSPSWFPDFFFFFFFLFRAWRRSWPSSTIPSTASSSSSSQRSPSSSGASGAQTLPRASRRDSHCPKLDWHSLLLPPRDLARPGLGHLRCQRRRSQTLRRWVPPTARPFPSGAGRHQQVPRRRLQGVRLPAGRWRSGLVRLSWTAN